MKYLTSTEDRIVYAFDEFLETLEWIYRREAGSGEYDVDMFAQMVDDHCGWDAGEAFKERMAE
jgi:hypothetical protein